MAASGVSTGRRIKKFYKTVAIEERSGRFAILLDGRAAKTPAKAALAAPTRTLADAIAAEWNGDADMVDFDAMALTRLAATVIDLAGRDRSNWVREILGFLKSDVLCYRAAEPAALVARQEEAGRPVLGWFSDVLGARLVVTTGVIAVDQSPDAVKAVEDRLAALDDWTLLGVRRAAELTGSAVLGLALHAQAFEADAVFAASRIDEHFQQERWGVDAEASARENRLKSEFLAVDQWLRSLAA